MKMRKFFHVVAVMLSSLTSMITHAKAQESTTKEKKGEGEVTRHHRHHNGLSGASDESSLSDPPRRSKLLPSFDSENIKNSKHAATWRSYDDQEAIRPRRQSSIRR